MTEPSIGFAQVTGWPSESAYRRTGLPAGSARNEATSGPTRSVGLGRSFLVEFAILYAPDPNFRKDAGLTGQQFALFPPDAGTRSTVPEGLHYVAEFSAPDAERDLIGRISALPLQPRPASSSY